MTFSRKFDGFYGGVIEHCSKVLLANAISSSCSRYSSRISLMPSL